jgi:hypothetical protein
VTFAPNQVITAEEWQKRHEGHPVRTHVEKVSIKRMHWLICDKCNACHLFKMETIPEGEECEDPHHDGRPAKVRQEHPGAG